MTLSGTEAAVFFVFDNERVKEESDFVEDGILYFSPSQIEKSQQHGFIGQLIGISRFLRATFGSPASVCCLQDSKVAFRHVEHYTLGLSGKVQCSSSLLLQLLNQLVGMFQFYQGGFSILEQACAVSGKDFHEELRKSWDCFTAFIKRYGDTVSSDFQSLPFLKVSKEIELDIYLQSSHLLEEICSIVPGAKAGCLFYDSQVCCSQMSAEMTSRVAVVRPKQHNLPCQQLAPDLELQGIRLLKVYLTPTEVQSLNSIHRLPCQTFVDSKYLTRHLSLSENEAGFVRTVVPRVACNGLASSDSEISATSHSFRTSVNGIYGATVIGDHSETAALRSSVDNGYLANEDRLPAFDSLVEMEMFVQGSSDSVCLLLMESGSLSDISILKKTWKHVLLCISEIERLIRGTVCSTASDSKGESNPDLRYLTFNSATGSLSGNMLQPVASPEHDFCLAAQMMHSEFKADSETTEITLRTSQSVFTGIRDGFDEFFCWSTSSPLKPGLPSSKSEPNTDQLIKKLKEVKLKSA